MHVERKWVVRILAGMGVGVGALLLGAVLRVTIRPNLQGGGGEAAARITSQKDLAAALLNPETREAAIRSLRNVQDIEVGALVADLSHKSSDPDVRAACLTALGEIGDPQGVHALSIGARDLEARVRVAAVQAMGKIAVPAAHGALGEALTDMALPVREAAAKALAASEGHDTAVPALVKALTDEREVAVRRTVALALGKVSVKPARQALLQVLQTDTEAAIRGAAVESLIRVDDDVKVKGLACALGDVSPAVRDRARPAFVTLDAKAIPALETALRSAEFARSIGGQQGAAVLRDAVKLFDGFAVPDTAGALMRILEIAAETGGAGKVRFPEIRQETIGALAKLGAPALAAVTNPVLRAETRMDLKSAGAEVLVRMGAPAVAAIRSYVASLKVLPSVEETGLWKSALQRIGGDAAGAAVAEVTAKDPIACFAALAAQATNAAAASPVAASNPPAGPSCEFEVVLQGAIYDGNPPSAYAKRTANLPWLAGRQEEEPVQKFEPKNRTRLRLDLACENGEWQPVAGHGLNLGVHVGRVTRASVDRDAMEFQVEIGIANDPWLLGGYGEYAIALRRKADGTFEGTYKGKNRNLPVEGQATATAKPARPPVAGGFRPVAPGERPRILFRKHDLPLLRARLNTPMGREAFRRMATSSDPICLGVVYQLTGDLTYAERAAPLVKAEKDNHDMGFRGLGQVFGPRWSTVAIAYDLCCEAWSPEFRSEVERFLLECSRATTVNMAKFSSSANSKPGSNYFAPICGGGAMLSLAYWMDKGGPPIAPAGASIVPLTPIPSAPAGVPVRPLMERRPPTEWIWSGAILGQTHPDGLLDAAGKDLSALKEGASFTIAGAAYTLQPVPDDCRRSDGVYPWLSFQSLYPGRKEVGFLLHTVVECEKPGFYKIAFPPEGLTGVCIAGTRVLNQAMLKMDKGFYPVTLAFSADRDIMGSVGVAFSLIAENEKQALVLLQENIERTQRDQVWHDVDKAEWERTGMDAEKIRVFRKCRILMYRNSREMMGDGGFQSEGEGYTHHAMTPLRYEVGHWNMFGRTVSAYPDITHFPFRYLAASVLQERSRGNPSLYMQAFNGHTDIGGGASFYIVGFPIIPDAYKPGVLWVWNRLHGVDPEKPETLANLVKDARESMLVYTFVNYPLDPATGKPGMKSVHPSGCFPLTYQARTKGLYLFRNRWQDADDIVFQVYANQKRSMGHGQQNAGALRLYGLGHSWMRITGERDAIHCLDSVVLLPENLTAEGGEGFVTAWNGDPDGSGHVTVDLKGVYRALTEAEKKRREKSQENVRTEIIGKNAVRNLPPREDDPNIRGLRAAAADYSGKSGAPALFALVDKIEGGKKRLWLWHLPSGQDLSYKVLPDGKSFQIAQGDATLTATFVAPMSVKVHAAARMDDFVKDSMMLTGFDGYGVNHPGFAAEGEPGTSFFVVWTLQRGPAPEVKIEKGESLDSVVRVGERKVRFDGNRVVIE